MKEKKATEQLLSLIFSQGGLLSRSLKNFEERQGQKEMALQILNAYEEEKIALIEAGTGIGKSLAYLVPAVYWALKHQEKTVITTHTIALQEQLLYKDIPFLLKAMDVELEACLVKGMSNYLCLRKLKELQDQPLLFSLEETKEVQRLEEWVDKTEEGSRSDIPFSIASATWEKVSAEREACNHVQCPHYKECFFFKARKRAAEAQILIVNHHLLLADIQRKRQNPGQEAILPFYNRLVIDEAHHLEDVSLESFAARLDRLSLLKQMGKLHSDSHPERSRLTLLRQALSTLPTIPPLLLQKLETEIPVQRRKCHTELEEAFAHIDTLFDVKEKEMRKRITESLTQAPFWKKTLIPSLSICAEEISRLQLALQGLLMDLEEFKEKVSSHLLEIHSLSQRLEEAVHFLEQFILDEPQEKRVRWIEKQGSNFTLVDASLDVSYFLNEHLFSSLCTSILCSATITTARSFDFLKKRLGLDAHQEKLKEEIFDSPFDYASRSLFAVPIDMPSPSSSDFLSACAKVCSEAIAISKGSVFLLFTSYEMLQNCHKLLLATPLLHRYPFLKQGDLPRHILLEQFKQKEGSVLFATDSFWEGVDVPGEALRCVIIIKLPFSVPTDPLYEAYAQSLEKEGLDPFFDYSVPEAVLKFKQGFGRLMRSQSDRGCVLCLDQRLLIKSYGKHFLESLPPSRTCFAPTPEILSQMRHFYATVK